MTIRREWLDWDAPALPAAARWLINRAAGRPQASSSPVSRCCDLQRTVCVLPGRRAGRLLLGQLLAACGESQLQLIPPTVLTPGALVDFMLQPRSETPAANPVEVELAWLAAMRANSDRLSALLPAPPEQDDLAGWRKLAKIAAQLHAELAGQRIGFAQAADAADRMGSEGDRWRVLQELHGSYVSHLKKASLICPHQAREDALDLMTRARGASEWPIDDLVLIGVVELNQLQRSVINLLDEHVSTLIHAPQSLHDHFDSAGCVDAARWSNKLIQLTDQQVIIADRPDDQVQRTLQAIAAFAGDSSADEVIIGLGDPALAAALQHAGQWAGLSLRFGEATLLRQSAPFRALQALGRWIDQPRFAHFSELLRHPDIEHWLERRVPRAKRGIENWLSLLDRYFAEHLQERVTGAWLGDESYRMPIAAIYQAVGSLVNELSRKPLRPIGQWAQPMVDVLNHLYAEADSSGWHQDRDACEAICSALSAFAEAPQALQPMVSAAQAINMTLEQVADDPLPAEVEPEQVEMLGWLELHLDPAANLIITGFSEGFVPQSATADPFLPDSLRAGLGLACNASRYARDAYLLSAMNASRAHLTVVAGRQSARGEPLTPSRLLLQCEDAQLVRRIGALCGENSQDQRREQVPMGLRPSDSGRSKFAIPALPLPLPLRGYMKITEFRDYLACPYRYALGRLLGLEACDAASFELDPMQFGNLAHEVLCAFGADESINRSDHRDQIERYLLRALQARVDQHYGTLLLPAVRIQLARLEQRLKSFAGLQAQLAEEGWEIRFCELSFQREIALDIPGDYPMPLWGKIDRIDYHASSGTWRIIDYKTSEAAGSPHQAHHKREVLKDPSELQWHDLQLPLYRLLATRSVHNIQGEIELAYICLPKQADGAAVKLAEWTQDHLDHAFETARAVVRNIRAQKFAINRDYDGPADHYARICQTMTFAEREPAEAEA